MEPIENIKGKNMTDNDFFKLTKEQLDNKTKENIELHNRIEVLENIILHLRCKFINIMNIFEKSDITWIDNIIQLIDDNVKQPEINSNIQRDKYLNHIKKKMDGN